MRCLLRTAGTCPAITPRRANGAAQATMLGGLPGVVHREAAFLRALEEVAADGAAADLGVDELAGDQLPALDGDRVEDVDRTRNAQGSKIAQLLRDEALRRRRVAARDHHVPDPARSGRFQQLFGPTRVLQFGKPVYDKAYRTGRQHERDYLRRQKSFGAHFPEQLATYYLSQPRHPKSTSTGMKRSTAFARRASSKANVLFPVPPAPQSHSINPLPCASASRMDSSPPRST